jgi:tetratricopeptide (TPR) repeat protein
MIARIRAYVVGADTAWAALLAVALFAVYAAGATRTIYVGDSGELVSAVHILGIPHPTGYPLYVMLGKLWTLLVPIGSIAFRMSLFSAACAALACALLYRLCRAFGLHPVAALMAALLVAFAPSYWGEANIQRVYALNAVFVVLALTSAGGWYRTREPAFIVLTAFVCGLGATNHTVMGFFAIAFAIFALVNEPALLRRWKVIGQAALALVVGLLPYLYLPIRSRMNPRLDWGNPETLQGFLDVVLRRGFWERAFIERPSDVLLIAADYARGMGVELAWAGAALAVYGAVAGWRRRWPVLLALLVMALNLTALTIHGSRSDIFIWHRYYIPSYIMAAMLAAFGSHLPRPRRPGARRAPPLVIPAFLLVTGWRRFDRSRYRIADEFSRAVLKSVPPGASLIATDDNILFVLIYLTLVENLRPDVNLILQGVGGADLPPLRFNPDTDPLFFTHHPNWHLPQLEIVPVGLVFRAWRAGKPPPEPDIPISGLDGEHDPRVPKDYLTQNLIGHYYYMLGFNYERRDWLKARRYFTEAAAAAPGNDVLFYNLGLIYERNGLIDDAIAAFRRSHEINPRHIASSSKADASDRLADLSVLRRRWARAEAALAGDPALRNMRPDTATYELQLGELLEAHGEELDARGHRLMALEIGAGLR